MRELRRVALVGVKLDQRGTLLEYEQTANLAAAPSDSFPLLALAVRNTTDVAIVREASACMLWPRLYRSGSWELPVRDWLGWQGAHCWAHSP